MSSERITTIAPSRGWSLPRFREVFQRRELLLFLAWRDISSRYRQSLLGILWAVIQPLAMMAAFTLVFGEVADVETGGVNYAVVALTGLVIWQLFARTLAGSANVIVANANMVTKIYFPRLVLPLASGLSALVDFAVALPVMLVVVLVLGEELRWSLLLLPLFAAMAALIALGTGLWLAAINVHYRDVAHAVPFAIQLWLFMTPVAYPLSALPDPWQQVAALNPMTGPVDAFRWSVLQSGPFPWVEVGASAVAAAFLLLSGAVFFQSAQRSFADVV